MGLKLPGGEMPPTRAPRNKKLKPSSFARVRSISDTRTWSRNLLDLQHSEEVRDVFDMGPRAFHQAGLDHVVRHRPGEDQRIPRRGELERLVGAIFRRSPSRGPR